MPLDVLLSVVCRRWPIFISLLLQVSVKCNYSDSSSTIIQSCRGDASENILSFATELGVDCLV